MRFVNFFMDLNTVEDFFEFKQCNSLHCLHILKKVYYTDYCIYMAKFKNKCEKAGTKYIE